MKKIDLILDRDFYNQDTILVAQKLLGCSIFVRHDNIVLKAEIIETEAYCGVNDLACHASKGITKRTKVMFGPPGYVYVYMIYGMYYCLNFVTEKEGNGCAVLIRGISYLQNENNKKQVIKLNGPGKTCKYLKIDKSFYGLDLTTCDKIWVEKCRLDNLEFEAKKRIGIDYAGEYKDKLWRFVLKHPELLYE